MSKRIVDLTLSEKLRNFRIDRPSEWMMDEFMRDAKELEEQLAESDHALDCMTLAAGELQDLCDKLEKQLEAGLSVVDNAMLNEHVRRLLKAAIGDKS